MSESRPMTVTYYETDLHLTCEEYEALNVAALEDPVEADRLAREYLRREQQKGAAS